MSYQTLTLAREGAVATVMLNRPEQRNPIDSAGCRELVSALDACDQDTSTRVIVVAAAGKHFSAGGDLKAFRDVEPMAALDHVTPVIDVATTMFRLRKPTIARVHGLALGGGAGLISMCDFAIAARSVQIGYPEINIGLIPATVGVLLARMVPRRVAADLLFTGRWIGAEQAAALHIINEVVPDAGLDDRVAELAHDLAQKSPLAMRQLKAAFYSEADLPLQHALESAVDKFATLLSAEDGKEGIRAFFDKRAAKWANQ